MRERSFNRHGRPAGSAARAAAVLLASSWAWPGLAVPPSAPTVAEFLEQEALGVEGVAQDLLRAAEGLEREGCGAAAADLTRHAAALYPEDPDLTELVKRRGELSDPEGGVPERSQRTLDAARRSAGRALTRFGDWMAERDGIAPAAWVYRRAEALGDTEVVRTRGELFAKEEEANRALGDLRGAPRQGGTNGTGVAGRTTYAFRLPSAWSPDRTWPILFAPHGTGGGWGTGGDDEVGMLTQWGGVLSEGFILCSVRDPEMIAGGPPNEGASVVAIETALAALAVRWRADPRRVCLRAGGTGGLVCFAYLQAHPERLAAFEVVQGKFHGINVRPGSAALQVPVRLGLRMSDNPGARVGTSETTQGQHDAVHAEQMGAARQAVERLGFTRFEWMGEKYPGSDAAWFRACCEARTPRAPAGGRARRPGGH